MIEQREIVIVGAGPVGLSLALGLARKGIDVLVLEKELKTVEHSRAPAIWPKTQEVLARLGVLDRFTREGLVVPTIQLWDTDHGQVLLRLPITELRNLTDYPHLLILPQSMTEQFLYEAIRDTTEAEIRFASEAISVNQHQSGVDVRYLTDDQKHWVRGRFVAGCDGAHSRIRDEIGASLEGITYPVRAALADVRVARDESNHDFRLTTKPNPAIGIRINDKLWRLILPYSKKRQQLSIEERRRDAGQSLFAGAECTAVWQSDFRLHRRVSTHWLDRRIILAGDAAHLNSPVGGEGMNAGIHDANELTNALAEALQGDETRSLTNYADRRRHAIEHGVNPFTGGLTRLLLTGSGRLVRPALSIGNKVLGITPVRRRILQRLAMLNIR